MQYALYVLNYKKINKNSEKYTKYGKKYIKKNDLGVFYVSIL